MDIENIRALAEMIDAHGLTSIEVSEGNIKIRLEKTSLPASMQARPAEGTAPDAAAAAESGAEGSSVNFSHLIEVKSPFVGVFYSAPSADAETFISIGSKVKKGDVLCIIETLKLMNEILAEQDGEIVDICVKNGDIVEYGQILLKMF